MIKILSSLDSNLFYFINTYITNPFLDFIFIFFHDAHKNIYVIVPIFFLLLLFIYKNKLKRVSLLLLLPGIILTDQIGRGIKNLEIRERPYIQMSNVNLLVDVNLNDDGTYKITKSSKKSFPSNHAANIFLICSFLTFIYPHNKKYFFTIAVLISISRIYVGVHYPLDVVIGATIGLIISYLIQKVSKRLIRQSIIR